jgi:hypothetical protein
MFRISPTKLFGIVALGIAFHSAAHGAQKPEFPPELAGVWVTTKEDNLGGNSGGEMLKPDQKAKVCADLTKNPVMRHSFEGVIVLKGTSMIAWDGNCSVVGGFTGSNGKYSTKWTCKGHHATNRGTVSFELRSNATGETLIKKTSFSQGGEYTNIYDEKCR